MDPCAFVRILVGNVGIKFRSPAKASPSRVLSPSTSHFSCKIKLKDFPQQIAAVPLVQHEEINNSVVASFTLSKSQIDKIVSKSNSSSPCLKIEVYAEPDSNTCVFSSGKLIGKVSVPLDLKGAESKALIFQNGWVVLGDDKSKKNGSSSSSQLSLTVRAEPDPRFVFQFDGEPECSPQVFQVQGSVKQAVFTCKFSFRCSSDRNIRSRSSIETTTTRTWLPSFKSDRDQVSRERKGWSITVHDLPGSPVAMASMVTPFVPSPGSDRVSRNNPGAWLILRPDCNTWKPWGRLQAWREQGSSDAVGYRFDIFLDDVETKTVANSVVSTKHGGKFSIDLTTKLPGTPLISPQSSGDFGSGSRNSSRPGSGSGSDFSFTSVPTHFNTWCKGFVMSSTVEGGGEASKPEVEVGVRYVSCTEDAAAYVALAAAMDLSMDACRLFSQKLRKELRQQTQKFVV